jgi:hypothetical protein
VAHVEDKDYNMKDEYYSRTDDYHNTWVSSENEDYSIKNK